jgi:hypothetical protein
MRVGTDNRLKLTVACTLAAVSLLLMGRSMMDGFPVQTVSGTGAGRGDGRTKSSVTQNASNLKTFDPTLRSDRLELSEGTEYVGTGRNIFRKLVPVLRTPVRPNPSPPAPSTKSSPPTLHLRVFGFANMPGDAMKIFLSEDGDVFIGKEGDIINRRYKLLHVTPKSVEMEDLLNDVRQTLPLDQG